MDIANFISIQHAKLETSSSKPPMEIHQPAADLNIKQRTGKVDISVEAAKVHIDQTQAFADAGLVSSLKNTSQFAQKANQTAKKYVAKLAREGEQLKAIEGNGGGGKAIASISKQNSKLLNYQTELGFMPESAFKVKFKTTPATISFQVEQAGAEVKINKNPPRIYIPRWEIQHYIKQKSDITFHFSGGQINQIL